MTLKAFDLCPSVSNIGQLFDEPCSISSIEGSGNNLFVGTTKGHVVSFSVHELVDVHGKCRVSCEQWATSVLPTRKPIAQLKSASAFNRLLTLSDCHLFLLRLENLEPLGNPVVKNVTMFAVNENPTVDDSNPMSAFCIQVAFATSKKQILVGEISKDRFRMMREISVQENVIAMAFDGFCICYATTVYYYLHHLGVDTNQHLFPFDINDTKPVVRRIGKEEFVLTAPGDLGMFVCGEGMSVRPPVGFDSAGVVDFAFYQPYLIVVGEEAITVHSISDQKQCQMIPFVNGVQVGNFDSQIFVASGQDVYKLSPVSWRKQVSALLADKKVPEALELSRTCHKGGLSDEEFQKIYVKLQQQAAFIELELAHWEEAKDLLIESHIDLREVIRLYPDYLPPSTQFTPTAPPFHNIPNVQYIAKGNEEILRQANEFLLDLLMSARLEPFCQRWLKEIDTAIVKVTADLSQMAALSNLLEQSRSFDLSDCLSYLKSKRRFHATALLLSDLGRLGDAVAIWKRLMDGSDVDESFPGIVVVIDALLLCEDGGVVTDNLPWIVQYDPEKAQDLVLDYPHPQSLNHESLIKTFHDHEDQLLLVLEHLVESKVEKEPVHTTLALMYLRRITGSEGFAKNSNEVKGYRQKLRNLLNESDHYRVRHILSQLEGVSGFYHEVAILLGKLGQYKEAFTVLVQDAGDFEAAEHYCTQWSATMKRRERQDLYETLLKIYLLPKTGSLDDFVAPILRLLNSPGLEINLVEVLEYLPSHWSLSLLSQLVTRSTAKTRATASQLQLHSQLTKARLDSLLLEKHQLARAPILITDNKRCPVCDKPFYEAGCFVYPSGTVVHRECAENKDLCPTTGQLFSIDPLL